MHQIEIFSTGSTVCDTVITLVQKVASECNDISVINVSDAQAAARARDLGLRSFPAVVLDGEVLSFDLMAAFSSLAAGWNYLETFGCDDLPAELPQVDARNPREGSLPLPQKMTLPCGRLR